MRADLSGNARFLQVFFSFKCRPDAKKMGVAAGRSFHNGSVCQGAEVFLHVFFRDLLAFRRAVASLGKLPGGMGRHAATGQLLARVFVVLFPYLLQGGNGVRLRFQRRLAPAGVFNGAPGGLVLVFVVDGGKHGTLGPCFGGLVDEADSVSVQMPPVREDDQMVEFDGIQGSSVFIRPLNEPVAEFLRGNVIGHADSCGRYYRKRGRFSQH